MFLLLFNGTKYGIFATKLLLLKDLDIIFSVVTGKNFVFLISVSNRKSAVQM